MGDGNSFGSVAVMADGQVMRPGNAICYIMGKLSRESGMLFDGIRFDSEVSRDSFDKILDVNYKNPRAF